MTFRRASETTKQQAVELYMTTDASAQQIADECGVSRMTLYRWLREAGVERQDRVIKKPDAFFKYLPDLDGIVINYEGKEIFIKRENILRDLYTQSLIGMSLLFKDYSGNHHVFKIVGEQE